MMPITDFDSLLTAARQQAQPQRLLFVFTKAVLPDDHTPAEAERFAAGHGGILLPVMCVDKAPDEVPNFAALAAEAGYMGEAWTVLFVAALDGRHGQPPGPADAELPLTRMVQTIRSGGDVSRYLAFDGQGEPVRFV